MSNIHNHNRDIIELTLYKGDYWDFHLHEGMGDNNIYTDGLATDCLSVYIDTTDPACIWMDELYSKSEYFWETAKSEGVTLYNIGLTGVDNGLIKYDKNRITNKEFFKLYTQSELEILPNDSRLRLIPVNGNNKVYSYSTESVLDGNDNVMKLNGGWFQGFFETCDGEYGVLPHTIGQGWVMETVIKPLTSQTHFGTILNDIHPENEGIFLYIGTRAENKWWKLYNVNADDIEDNRYAESGYIDTDSASANNTTDYCTSSNDGMLATEEYVDYSELLDDDTKKKVKTIIPLKGYAQEGYVENVTSDYMTNYRAFEDGYVEKDITLDNDNAVETKDGFNLGQPNIKMIETDNKFILFNQSADGLTTKTYKDGDVVKLHYVEQPKSLNYFTLFNRTSNGYTTKTINKLLSDLNKDYNINSDLYRNAIAFQITPKGSIGFKYLVKDCDHENQYKIESLFTRENTVSFDEWHTISVKITPTRPTYNLLNPKCQPAARNTDKMKIHIFVDGKLKLCSKELPILNLRKLNDLDSRQESVPFNISVGGGTQGLCDVVYMDYMQTPKDILPLEKEFGGSFIGLLKTFRFYTCPLSFSQIQSNSKFDGTNRL